MVASDGYIGLHACAHATASDEITEDHSMRQCDHCFTMMLLLGAFAQIMRRPAVPPTLNTVASGTTALDNLIADTERAAGAHGYVALRRSG